MQELLLADFTDIDKVRATFENIRAKSESFRETWDNICPGFHKWFYKKRG